MNSSDLRAAFIQAVNETRMQLRAELWLAEDRMEAELDLATGTNHYERRLRRHMGDTS